MSKQLSSARLHLCQPRASIPGGSKEERERDFERTMRHEGPFLIQDGTRSHPSRRACPE